MGKIASVRCFFDVGTTNFWPLWCRCLKRSLPFLTKQSHRQEIRNILTLRKENTELRALAVKLSNLLGDLPAQEWEDAVAAHAYGPPPTSR